MALNLDEKRRQIREAFSVFDEEGKGVCAETHLSTIVFSLGLNLSLEELQKLLDDVRGDEPSKVLEYEKVEAVLLQVFQSPLTKRDSEDVIARAFRTLDTEGKGYLEEDELREYMLNYGEPFTENEWEMMSGVAVDVETKQVKYDEYAAVLALDR